MSVSKTDKRGSIAPTTSTDSTARQRKAGFPQEKIDYNQPVIVQNSKVTFSERLDKAREQHKTEIDDLLMEMDSVKKENDRLRRQQEDTYGITLDTVQRMKQELDRARTTRMFLLEDIAIRKEKCERMERDVFELNMKLESYTRKLEEFRNKKQEWQETSEKLQRAEEKCERLIKTNKNLRLLLSKHHIDPKGVEFDNGTGKRNTGGSLKATAAKSGNTKSSSLKGSHSNSQGRNGGRKLSRSMDDLRALQEAQEAEEIRKKYALTTRKAMGRGPPAYLGYYTSIHQNRLQFRNKAAGVQLPKISAV